MVRFICRETESFLQVTENFHAN